MSKEKVTAVRVTGRYLTEWVNNKLNEFELQLKVKEIYTTRFRSHDYEAGAAKLAIILGRESPMSNICLNCFYRMGELQRELKNGYKLKLKLELVNGKYINWEKSELTVTK
jgi:hypothetical protein